MSLKQIGDLTFLQAEAILDLHQKNRTRRLQAIQDEMRQLGDKTMPVYVIGMEI